MVEATWSSVVLPAPFGPIRIHRSSACAVQSTFRSSSDVSRRTDTPRSLSTSSDTAPPHAGRPPLQLGRTPAESEPMPLRACLANPIRRCAARDLSRYREDEMNQPRTTLLITLTGRDRPGVTSRLFGALARFPLSVTDIEQVTIRGRLVLGVLVGCEGEAESLDLTAIYRAVTDLATDLGLEAEITTGSA